MQISLKMGNCQIYGDCQKNNFDLCVVIDPDVDRLVLITDKEELFNEEHTITQAVKFITLKKKGMSS